MFKGTKDSMVKTAKPMSDVIKAIEDCSNYIGDVNVSESGNISTNAIRFEGFGYDPEISGYIIDKGEGKFFISIHHTSKVGVLAWVIGICFFPIGLLAFLPAYNGNQTMSLKVAQLLQEVKHALNN
jgi:hypothetical protein|tara:strand:- start:526 stop:903 length:378 start_codon:yes stop_codon:yes gene_type:complete